MADGRREGRGPGGRLSPARALRERVPEELKAGARLALARRLERRARTSGAVRGAALVLHAVGEPPADPAFEIEPPFSERQVDAVVGYLRRRYALVTASDLIPRARARRVGEPIPVALTFDDDLTSHRERAAPVLARHGAPGTAFLCTAEEPFWWQRLQAAADRGRLQPDALPEVASRLVTEVALRHPFALQRLARAVEELEPTAREAASARLAALAGDAPAPLGPHGAVALRQAGWELGFHTRRHHLLPGLGARELVVALTEGRERVPGGVPRTLAYPHGKAGAREAVAARDAGYQAAFTGAADVLRDGTDPHLIPRLQPHPRSLSRFALDLARALAAA